MEELKVIPIFQHENDMQKLMAIIKWLVLICIVLLTLLCVTNTAWIIYENSYTDSISYEAEQDGDSNNIHIVGGNDYGASESQSN